MAQRRLPALATGDFHRREHLAGWKTLLPAEKSEDGVVDYLRSNGPVALMAIEPAIETLGRAA